jgi:hypothetical protein
MKIFISLISAAGLFATVFSDARAGELYCGGTVEAIGYHAGNPPGLMLKLTGMNVPVFICNPDALWTVPGTAYTTTPSACKALYATLLTMKVRGDPVVSLLFDGANVPTSCTTWPAWTAANIRYLMY